MRACFIFCLLLLSGSLFAQLKLLSPSSKPADRAVQEVQTSSAARQAASRGSQARAATVLPFWDDFSYGGQLPDPRLWLDDSSTSVTYGIALNPPSFGVVTFDGINAKGVAYNNANTNNNTSGNTDSLQSVAIDLSQLTAAEQQSTYLSYYWQLRGAGELPDARDSLKLYFQDEAQQWHLIWSRTGGSTTNADLFQQQLLSLQEEGANRGVNFFHPEFKFKFQSFSRQNGQFDQWHLDYVYLDKNRSADGFYKDRAVSKAFVSLLRPYTAMPIDQFFTNPEQYLQPTLPFTAFSFSPPGQEPDVVKYLISVRTEQGELVYAMDEPAAVIGSNGLLKGQEFTTVENQRGVPPANLAPYSNRDSLYLIASLDMSSNEARPELDRNNKLTIVSVLDDYFAYDDGTAEAAVALNGRGARLAYRYQLAMTDTLSAVSFYFPFYNTSAANQNINLKIWTALAGVNGAEADVLRYTQSFLVRHTGNNEFVTFTLNNPQILPPGDFYIGYEQTGTTAIPIGFDRNTNSTLNIYQSINTTDWLTTFTEPGSLMIRPYFENKIDPTTLGIKDDSYFPALRLYPNPTRDQLFVESEARLLKLYDVQGRLVLQQEASPQTILQLGHLQTGMYLLQLHYKNGIQSKRIILAR